jgi:hypothetical protein
MNGTVRPIHVNSGWCSGGLKGDSGSAGTGFENVKSYLDPNAHCPVCGDSVFFYRSPNNGRVFFDDLGWPWPKHACTDKYKGEDDEIKRNVSSRFKFNFRTIEGKLLDVYVVDQFIERADGLLIRLKSAERGQRILIAVSRAEMTKQGIEISDVREAPSLVMLRARGPAGETEVSFMCARLQSVVVLLCVQNPHDKISSQKE